MAVGWVLILLLYMLLAGWGRQVKFVILQVFFEGLADEIYTDFQRFVSPGSFGNSSRIDVAMEYAYGTMTTIVAGRALGFEVNAFSKGNVFKVINKDLKIGFRIDPAHHGKIWGHRRWTQLIGQPDGRDKLQALRLEN